MTADSVAALLRIGRERGYIFASGPLVERLAHEHLDRVCAAAAASRVERDGSAFHVTLATKAELNELEAASRDSLEKDLAMLQPSGIVSLGLGSVTRAKQQASFVVLLWPALQAVRKAHVLPPVWPHITLGFDGADIHGCAKGALQLKPITQPPMPRDWDAVTAVCQYCS